MRTIRKFLRPISSVMASLILFVSCEQYDQDLGFQEQAFDYSMFRAYQNDKDVQSILKLIQESLKGRSDAYEKNKEILDSVNREMGTNLEIPDEVLRLSLEMQAHEIYDHSYQKGWLDQQDISIYEEFSNNIQNKGLDSALEDYENKIISLKLPSEEFAVHNAFANIIKSIDHENPSVFNVTSNNRSPWRCALALVAMTAAIASTASCVTIAACAVATALVINAGYAVADHCNDLVQEH